jgi:hypothetical protein
MGEWITQPVNHFRGRALPEPGIPAGYAALIERFEPGRAATSALGRDGDAAPPSPHSSWELLTPRHRSAETLEGQLVFALKWEGVDLGVLAALFKAVAADDVAALVRDTPTGAFARRIWFLYEWLTERTLDVPDPGKVRSVPVLDAEQQIALTSGTLSPRHKVVDNLPGTRRFCPLMRWTPALRAAASQGWSSERAKSWAGRARTW